MIGVVCAGAGARGAYEAGVLSVLLPWLLENHPEEEIVLLGTSAGAINTALFAGVLDRERSPHKSVSEALWIWRTIRPSEVFTGLRLTAPRVAARYGLEVLGLPVHLQSLLDSSPLRATMERRMDWSRLDRNLAGGGFIAAAAVAATNCGTGRTTVFVEGGVALPASDPVRAVDYLPAVLRPPHVQASAAIPVAFLPVSVEESPGREGWYVDGGVRLNAPISPALALGAQRVAVVATTPDPDRIQTPLEADPEPDVFDAIAVVLRSVLVDRMAEDIRHLRQVNELVTASGAAAVPLAGRSRPYVTIPNLYVGPVGTETIAEAARRIFRRYYRGPLSRVSDLGTLATLLGGVDGVHGELFSYLFIDGRFHAELIRMGRRDAFRVLAGGWC